MFSAHGSSTSGPACPLVVNEIGNAIPMAIGDPHLANLRGHRFDIHDGVHRLVHYPRGVPDTEASLMVDAHAVDMGASHDCYSVYLQQVRLSGTWIGDAINISTDENSPTAPSTSHAFGISFSTNHMDWNSLSKLDGDHLNLHGSSMPVSVTTDVREPSAEDAMGGEEITFKVGSQQHRVFIHVWSSRGGNSLTNGKGIRYLNLEARHLPKDSGGIIGLDDYSRPSASQCGLVQAERNLEKYIDDSLGGISLYKLARRTPKPHWTAAASTKN